MPANEETEAAVLLAFGEARAAGLDPQSCYLAGVDAWCRLHPDHKRSYAAKQAVALMLAEYGPMSTITK